MPRTRNYISPKQQQHRDGRREQQRQVDAYLRNSTPLRPGRIQTRLCPVTGRYVEVR